MSWNWPTGTK